MGGNPWTLLALLVAPQLGTAQLTPQYASLPYMTPLDADMDDAMQRWAARHKLERVASYRQLQGYSNQLRAMTMYCGPPLTIHSFKLPAGFNLRGVGSNEERATVRGEHQDVSYIVNKTSQALTPILPVAKVIVRLLTLGLDQGSIGLAGSSCCSVPVALSELLYAVSYKSSL